MLQTENRDIGPLLYVPFIPLYVITRTHKSAQDLSQDRD
jgi:hypothetical protein